jgi:two-component system sensor histidine kinase DctS
MITKTLNSYDFRHVLTTFGDRVVLINNKLKKVIWCSDKFLETYTQINLDSTLEQVINNIGKSKDAILTLKNYFNNKTKNVEKITIVCGKYMAVVFQYMDYMTIIRIEPILMSNEEANRYLADREQLLITSRSLSVSEMASTLAHEINQPIGAISNLLYGIRERIDHKKSFNKSILSALDKSIEQAEFVSRIITRIRDYTRTNSPDIQKIEIIGLINKCISLMDWEIKNINLNINYQTNLKAAYIRGDELMLQQVIINLIRNGIESIKSSQKVIEIKLKTERGYIHIYIKDNGCGLSDNDQDNIFMPFVSNKDRGMGIGLNICRSFVELHRGRIWLTRNSKQGCTSHVMLPYL